MTKMRADIAATAMAFFVSLCVVVTTASAVTNGFQAFTLESARRQEAMRNPRDVAPLRVQTLDQGERTLGDFRGQWILVNFIYTRCETLCVSMGSVFARLQQRLTSEIAAQKLGLLSVSFDPEHDGPMQLAAYRARHVKSASGWILGRPAPEDLPEWLDRFGVVVIPDEWGGFAHNAAIHVVAPDGRLRAILDPEDIESAVGMVQRAANE